MAAGVQTRPRCCSLWVLMRTIVNSSSVATMMTSTMPWSGKLSHFRPPLPPAQKVGAWNRRRGLRRVKSDSKHRTPRQKAFSVVTSFYGCLCLSTGICIDNSATRSSLACLDLLREPSALKTHLKTTTPRAWGRNRPVAAMKDGAVALLTVFSQLLPFVI